MIPFIFDYATPSTFEADADRALLGFAAHARRPVRFDATVVPSERLMLRFALETLGRLIWSDHSWKSDDEFRGLILDPIVTVHRDRVMFEAFSQDRAAYGLLTVDRAAFVPRGEVVTGTTHVDFSAWLYAAISELRSTRETRLRVGPDGLGIQTASAGGRFEKKVDVPEAWVRAFLELQAAMTLPGTRLSVRPVDLLAAIRFLQATKAKVSPRALRWVLEPGESAALILEPWEHRVELRGASHGFAESRVIRTWGRRKLALIEPLLPYAESVTVYLRGRAMPTFFAVDLGAIRFVLGLSSYTAADWSTTGLALAAARPEETAVVALGEALTQAVTLSTPQIRERLGPERALGAIAELVRRGRAVWDLESSTLRHRELFDTPPDLGRIFPVDGRTLEARWIIERGDLTLTSAAPRETRKLKRLTNPADGTVELRELTFRDWHFVGRHRGEPVEVVVSDEGRLIFARCTCAFFQEHLLQRGPCAHALATLRLGEARRVEVGSSVVADGPQAVTSSSG